ncbi:MAG: 2-succinyl-5-enolpyruvyl-6-hydroxy-3-cyclohexene-1-carboxylic-acid synthase [Oceanipulchritudo sp.]
MAEQAGRANGPFGRVVVRALKCLGVSHFVLSPGSRSTPLAIAMGELEPGKVTVCLDERSAAFYALGRIKATLDPVAVVCTSGTAGAHYYPAVIEAREAGLPLVVLTADRPPELRHCHCGQTIDQVKLFGTYPVFQAELPVPENSGLLFRQVREICRRSVEAAIGAPRGPVHLNCPFREPFFPEKGEGDSPPDSLFEDLRPVRRALADPGIVPVLPERTLILAGPRPCRDHASEWEALLDLSWQRGFPVLADASNAIRYHGGECPHLIIHYDRILRSGEAKQALKPDAVLLWGEPPTSKVLRQYLTGLDLPGYLVGEGKRGINPIHGRVEWAGKSITAFSERCRGPKGHYGEQWAVRDRQFENSLEAAMSEPHPLFEGDVHRLLGRLLPPEAAVFFASSMAIRDAEWFMPLRRESLHPFCQRGANGIDGTLSVARGIAAGLGRPVWLVTGDLAFLHDANGLLGAVSDRAGVFVILINNNGGGIFEFLPVSGRAPGFERLFASPQAVDFRMLTQAHGGKYCLADSLPELEEAILKWKGRGLMVAEVRIDRKQSRRLHKRFLQGLVQDSC